MPEFMFRNLSVKLFPVEGHDIQNCTDRTTFIECLPCTHLCTGTYTACYYSCPPPSRLQFCGPDTLTPPYCAATNPCNNSHLPAYVDDESRVILSPGVDAREELQLLKSKLQKSMTAVSARLEEIEKAAKPTSVDQIDALKSSLLAAVEELDQQRTQLEGGGQPPAQG
ncbi:MAG TPA: hypothetical protein VHZ03_12575 [Trebonia sp.]|nr:hypothetical protein [Trebonia sp.]